MKYFWKWKSIYAWKRTPTSNKSKKYLKAWLIFFTVLCLPIHSHIMNQYPLLRLNLGYFLLKMYLVWHSLNFLLPCITVGKYFIISITFIFNLYFLCFVVDEITSFMIMSIIFELNYHILPEGGCIHLISNNKWFFLYSS